MAFSSSLREAAQDFRAEQGDLLRARGGDAHRVRHESAWASRVLVALAREGDQGGDSTARPPQNRNSVGIHPQSVLN
jgi:hypothetical protein